MIFSVLFFPKMGRIGMEFFAAQDYEIKKENLSRELLETSEDDTDHY